MCARICACVCVCICIYVCLCICIHIHLLRARVGVHLHSCRRILFICTIQSLYNMRVYHRCFLTSVCVCVGRLEVGFFPACSRLALVAGMGGYVLAGGFVLYISLSVRVLGWWVCACLYMRAYTHKNYLGNSCEHRCGTDTWRTKRIQIDKSTVYI